MQIQTLLFFGTIVRRKLFILYRCISKGRVNALRTNVASIIKLCLNFNLHIPKIEFMFTNNKILHVNSKLHKQFTLYDPNWVHVVGKKKKKAKVYYIHIYVCSYLHTHTCRKAFPELLLEACPLMYPKYVFPFLKPWNLLFFNTVHYRI